MLLRDIPKVELHMHLDGSVPINLISNITNEDINVIKDKMVAPDKCINLADYLTSFDYPCSFMQSKHDLIMVCSAVLNNLLSENVIYAEVRFAPFKHTSYGLGIYEVIDAVIQGFKNDFIKVNLILCMMRNDSFEVNKSVIDAAKSYLGNGVVAVDLAGDEHSFPTSNFKELFDYAKDLNIPFTIHAGEADSASSVWSAIDFGAKRIGHGITSIDDKGLLDKMKEDKIHLEICPTSNVQTNVVSSMNVHPIKYFFDNGIRVSVNTDNRTVSNTCLTNEYEKLIKDLNFDIRDIIKMNLYAIEDSFLSSEEKVYLKEKYKSYFN